MTRLVVGCMTGTSVDGLDAALVRIEGTGLAMTAQVVRGASGPLGDVGTRLRRLADQEPMTAGQIAELSRDFALLHASVVRELLAGEHADFAAVHGQTVYHKPPASWQLFNAPVLAHELGVPVVTDLRGADLAAGGQGAPITPLADWVMLRDAKESRAVVNLGGFCNVTLLEAEQSEGTNTTSKPTPNPSLREGLPNPPASAGGSIRGGSIRGFDVCACNHLVDTVARRTMGKPFDEDGAAAMTGHVHDEALDDLRAVLMVQGSARRSLGTGDEAVSWVGRHWRGGAGVSPADLAATACEAIAEMIAAKVQGAGRVLLAGGGVKNRALVRAIGSCCSTFVEPVDKHGVPAEYREAACMAVLGALCADGVPITLAGVTGVKRPPVSGVWAGATPKAEG